MRKVLVIAGVVILLAGLGGLLYYFVFGSDASGTTAPSGPSTVITDPEIINQQVVAFIRNPFKDDYEMTRIAGYIDNKGDTYVKRAVIEIQLTDSEGGKRELVKYEVTDLPAQSRKQFDANAGSIGGARNATGTIVEMEVVEQ